MIYALITGTDVCRYTSIPSGMFNSKTILLLYGLCNVLNTLGGIPGKLALTERFAVPAKETCTIPLVVPTLHSYTVFFFQKTILSYLKVYYVVTDSDTYIRPVWVAISYLHANPKWFLPALCVDITSDILTYYNCPWEYPYAVQ